MRETYAGIIHAQGGCFQCHGTTTKWWGKNALAVAARHHDATGHSVWCEQVMSVRYGPPPHDESVKSK